MNANNMIPLRMKTGSTVRMIMFSQKNAIHRLLIMWHITPNNVNYSCFLTTYMICIKKCMLHILKSNCGYYVLENKCRTGVGKTYGNKLITKFKNDHFVNICRSHIQTWKAMLYSIENFNRISMGNSSYRIPHYCLTITYLHCLQWLCYCLCQMFVDHVTHQRSGNAICWVMHAIYIKLGTYR